MLLLSIQFWDSSHILQNLNELSKREVVQDNVSFCFKLRCGCLEAYAMKNFNLQTGSLIERKNLIKLLL